MRRARIGHLHSPPVPVFAPTSPNNLEYLLAVSKHMAHPLHPVYDDGKGGGWKWWELHFVLLKSHISAYVRCLAGKVCGLVRSTGGTSQGEDKLGARDKVLDTKVAHWACPGRAPGEHSPMCVFMSTAFPPLPSNRENPPGSNKNPRARQKETPGITQRPLVTIHKHLGTPAIVVCRGPLHRVKSLEISERCRTARAPCDNTLRVCPWKCHQMTSDAFVGRGRRCVWANRPCPNQVPSTVPNTVPDTTTMFCTHHHPALPPHTAYNAAPSCPVL